MPQQELTSDEMFGIAKRINHELEQFPLHTHSAIIEMAKVGVQHRNLVTQHQDRQTQQDQQERIIRLKEQEMERHQQQQRDREKLAPTLVEPPPN